MTLFICTSSGSIPPVSNLPEEKVIPSPTIKTMREQETNHDVAEIPLIPPDLFPIRGVDDMIFPSEPFRPSGVDDSLKKNQFLPDPRPCGRWQHTTVIIGHEFYVYGGISNGGAGSLNDVWMYNGAGGSWTKLEKNELCMLPVRVNPKLSSSNNGARPPFFPSPPPLRLAPGIDSERIQRLKSEQEKKVTKNIRPIPIDKMTPVPTQEPLMPDQEAYVSKTSAKLLRRRRRLQSYHKLGVLHLPPAEHNKLQTQPRTLNDLWVYDISKRRWVQPFPTERQPPPRWLHDAVTINGKMMIFGGVTNNLMLLNDMWEYSPKSNSWKELSEGLMEDMDRPTPREGHSMVAADNNMNPIIFGGIGYGYVPYNDVWRYVVQTEMWERIETIDEKEEKESGSTEYKEPTRPPARWMHTAASVDGTKGTEMYIFGGCSSTFAPMDDLWKLNVVEKKWENMMGNRRMIRPAGRWLHSASVLPIDDQNNIYAIVIYGGGINNQPMDDLWYWNTKDKVWEEMHAFTDRPFARAGHTLVSVIKGNVAKEAPSDDTPNNKGKSKLLRFRRRLLGFLGGAVGAGKTKLAGVKGEGGSSDVFALDGVQEKVEVDHNVAVTTDDISARRPTTVADEFLFLFGGMSERGLGASSTKGGLGPDPQYPLDF